MADPASRQPIVQQQQPKDALLDVRRKLESISAEHKAFGTAMTQSLDVVRRALDEFGFVAPGGGGGGGSLAISFNGGKDACVVLYLLLLVLAERDELDRLWATTGENRIRVVYFEKEEFPEIDEFMREVSSTYGFEFQKYTVSYKDGMRDLVDNYGVKGVIMGQRRGDPWTESMEWFTPSTPGWAEFTRINPALEWKFCNVWRFLRGSGLPYCVLYDQGYTSLGERGDTAKNEALRLPNGEYRPAYELAEEEEHLERYPRSPSSGGGSGAEQSTSADGGGGAAGRGEGGGGGGGSNSGGGEGGSGGGSSSSGEPRAPKRISAWDKRWDPLDESGDDAMLSQRGVSESGGGKAEGGTKVSDRGAYFPGLVSETARVPGSGGAAGGVPARLSDCGLGMEGGREVVEMETRTCLQPEGKERGVSAGWVGSSARWLPVTVALALVLAAVGGRRSDSTRGGGESTAVEGSSS